MILDSADLGGGLYEAGPAPLSQNSDVAPSTAAVDPSAAVVQSLEVIADPASLLSEVLPPDPATSKLPIGLAVLGLCVFGVIWANSIDQKGRGK